MQYPLEGLHLFIRATLKPTAFNHCDIKTFDTQQLSEEITTLTTTARISICCYLAAATNEAQAKYMLHAMNVALHDLLNTIDHYRQEMASFKPGTVTGKLHLLYQDVYGHIIALIDFMQENFHTAMVVSLPVCPAKQSGDVEQLPPLLTNLSVAQLGFMRLMVDTGIIANKQAVTTLITKTARCVQTKKTNQISSESLRIKYYTPEQPAINILKDYIAQMMNLLRNY